MQHGSVPQALLNTGPAALPLEGLAFLNSVQCKHLPSSSCSCLLPALIWENGFSLQLSPVKSLYYWALSIFSSSLLSSSKTSCLTYVSYIKETCSRITDTFQSSSGLAVLRAGAPCKHKYERKQATGTLLPSAWRHSHNPPKHEDREELPTVF